MLRRRRLIKLGLAAGGSALVAACMPDATGGQTAKPAPSATQGRAGKYALGRLAGPEIVLDPSRTPKAFKEAPALTALVRQRQLPPVAERIGQDPIVVKPLQAIGKYGGDLKRAFTGPGDRQNANRFNSGPDGLLQWDYEGKKVIPNVAKGYEMSSDGKVLTLTLRRGMRWSDGAPFTADDILFWFEDIYANREIVASKTGALQINGKDVTIEKVDTHTVRFVSPDPNFLLVPLLASATEIGGPASAIGSLINGYGGYAPKHYLMKFLPRYTTQAELDRQATAASFTGWVSYFKNRADWNLNADLPVLSPWKVVRGRELSRSTWQWERNPYSIWVDTEGNQLPYIDTITYTLAESLEVVALRATTGEYDVQDRGLDLVKLPVLLQSQDSGRYKIWLDPSPIVDFGIRLNLAYEEDPLIGDLLRKADFRRALSLGVDRDAINETFFLGTGTPSSNIPSDESPYFPGTEWRTKWATLDVAQANRLLDTVGLQQKDAEGYRTRTDGKGRLRLDYTVSTGSFADFAVIGEMIREQWKKIGIELAINSIQSTLLVQRARAGQLQLSGHIVGTEDIFITPSPVIPFDTTNYPGMIGIPYAQWLQSGGRTGKEPFAELKQAFDLWKKGYAAAESARNEAGRDIYKLAADQVFSIGVVGMGLVSYGIHLVKTSVGNVPERYISSNMTKAPAIALPQTFYFK